MRSGGIVASLAALSVAVAAVAANAAPAGGARRAPAAWVRALSDEWLTTRTATARRPAVARRAPFAGARALARLRRQNDDGVPEVYLALRETVDRHGHTWVRVRLPRRPNGSTGWVRRSALGPWRIVHTALVIDRRTLRATLYRAGRAIMRAPVGVGARGTPTPAGRFWVRDRLRPPYAGGPYGPLAFGTSAYSVLTDWPGGGVVGIHGTDQPRLIPGRPSHGCVRLRNADIVRLGRLMPVGTPVRIR